MDEELEDEGREAWQVLGQLRAAENGVFKILQLLVEEGHKVVQLRPGGVLYTAVSEMEHMSRNQYQMVTNATVVQDIR